MTLALSYDPSSNITTGFLLHAKSHGNQPTVHPMISVLLKTAHKLPHPMLPAVLFLEYWCDYLRFTLVTSMRDLIESKKQTGVLDEELKRWHREPTGLSNATTRSVPKQKGLNDVHQSLIVIHNHMMNDVPTFLQDFSASILEDFDEIKDLNQGHGHQQTIESSGQELKEYVLQIQSSSDTLLRQREQRLSQVDLQLKVVRNPDKLISSLPRPRRERASANLTMQLYNIMQQTNNDNNYLIALENKKDSRAMKTISIVTMIFLPGTAIAVRPLEPFPLSPHSFRICRLLSKSTNKKRQSSAWGHSSPLRQLRRNLPFLISSGSTGSSLFLLQSSCCLYGDLGWRERRKMTILKVGGKRTESRMEFFFSWVFPKDLLEEVVFFLKFRYR